MIPLVEPELQQAAAPEPNRARNLLAFMHTARQVRDAGNHLDGLILQEDAARHDVFAQNLLEGVGQVVAQQQRAEELLQPIIEGVRAIPVNAENERLLAASQRQLEELRTTQGSLEENLSKASFELKQREEDAEKLRRGLNQLQKSLKTVPHRHTEDVQKVGTIGAQLVAAHTKQGFQS